ncbi:MAG: shikimate dehydrogenase [Candidatus Eremiobacteraeota bacterium]|nr:shikimate dehydrogenase [Candidatus Eremiobacteraeota bacterium]
MTTPARRYAVVGSPVAHSLSPIMQQAAFATLHIEASYEAIDAGKDRAREVFARLRDEGFAGWNVTTPLKEEGMSFVDRLSPDASKARALNTIRAEPDGSLSGHNTDGLGFVRALAALWSWRPLHKNILILGTGPAARAIAIALQENGAATLACWSRDAQRAEQLAPPPGALVDLVVSALPAEAVVPTHIVQASNDDTLIFDLNYGRERSPVSGMRGGRRSDGLPLLLHQGALSFEWWTGRPAPLSAMRAALTSGR